MTNRLPSLCGIAGALLLAPMAFGAAPALPDRQGIEFFETKVRPVLAQHCYECHADKKQKGDLRVDSREALLTGGGTGPALVPGDPQRSLLVTAVRHSDPDLTMPPKKKLSDAEIAALEQWVKLGAPWPGGKAEAQAGTGRFTGKFTDEDRGYWFFQPLSKPALPSVKANARVRNAVDAFVLAKLEAAGLTLSREADKLTLIRRATFDLHGLPPTPAEIDAFLADTSEQAYEHLIDRLLASPRYGERFGRLWLDVVRYADSDGYKADDYRPHIWRYRDWVIDAFNADMPFDQFVTWQLAGDEAAPLDPGATIATGYLRLWPYEYNQRDVQRQWNDILDDVTTNAGEAFLGLSMHCARCHNHKFDPILQEDYFKLRASFEAILPDDTITAAAASQRAEYDRKHAAWDEKTRDIRAKIEAIEAPARAAVEKPAISKFIVEMQKILNAPREQLSPGDQQIKDLAWRQLVFEHKNIAGKIKGEEKTQLDKLYAQLREFDAIKPQPLPAATAVRDVGPVAPPTTIPGDKSHHVIAPGTLAILAGTPLAQGANREGEAPAEPRNTLDIRTTASTTSPGSGSAGASPSHQTSSHQTPSHQLPSQSTGRRLALAQWLTRPDNAMTTRVIVNRIWQSHFGAGIVATSNDFGRQGDKPTHPQLLDHLANEMVAGGWKIKRMHKLIMMSAAYRQESGDRSQKSGGRQEARSQPGTVVPDSQVSSNPKSEIRNPNSSTDPQSIDPHNALLWRYPARRLDAEQLRDAALVASGELNLAMYGTGVTDPNDRRAVWLKFMRNNRPEMLQVFDGPDGFNSVSRRNVTTIAPQALLLINGEFMAGRSRKLAEAVRKNTGGVQKAMIDLAHRRAYGRPATEREIADALAFIEAQAKTLAAAQLAQGAEEKPDDKPRTGVFVDLTRKPRMALADKPALAFHEFTLEAVFALRSIDQNANVRVIASQWDGNTEHPGWSVGVTGVKSKHQPQTLILQLVGKNEEGKPAYDVVVSGLKPQFDRPYHLVVSVKLSEIDSTGVTFHLRDLTGQTPVATASVGHTVVAGIDNSVAFVVGGRDVPEKAAAAHAFDGILDDVRLYAEGLSPMQLVGGRSPKLEGLVGDWRFERDALGKDASGKRNDLHVQGVAEATVAAKESKPAAATDPAFAAFIDYCHVLLNSNEFLYVD